MKLSNSINGKEFKKIFGELAKCNMFENAFGGWFKSSDESIIVLDLQKSKLGDYYDINIKIYIQGMFGNTYSKSKDLIKKDIGNIFRRQPSEYKSIFDFNEPMNDNERIDGLKKFFAEFIVPFTEKALSKVGIMELANKDEINLLSSVKAELYECL